MQPTVSELPIHLLKPFRIAHGTSSVRHNALVRLGSAFGEAGLPPYLGTTVSDVAAWIDHVGPLPSFQPGDVPVERLLAGLPAGPPAARCALDLALHDLWGQALGMPLHRLFGLDPTDAPRTFVTLSISTDMDQLRKDASTYRAVDRLKLKVGSGDPEQDLLAIRTARESTDALVAVDANGAWSIAEAAHILPLLSELDLALVEQPVRHGNAADWHRLRSDLGDAPCPPLFADESLFSMRDLVELHGAIDGINVKLAKCGGLSAARGLIAAARALDLGVLVGCMIESSLAVAAAAHLSPLADFADLDAPLLIRDDPFGGLHIEDGVVKPPAAPGIGVTPKFDLTSDR